MAKGRDYTITTVSSSLRQRDNTVGPSYQIPFSLTPGINRLRSMCLPYVGGGIPKGAFVYDREACGIGEVESTLNYTEVVNATNTNGTNPLHIGSLYLEARTYNTIGAIIGELYLGGTATVTLELRESTNGSSLLSLNSTMASANHSYITQENITVSSSGWYDLVLYANSELAISSVRGIYYSYNN